MRRARLWAAIHLPVFGKIVGFCILFAANMALLFVGGERECRCREREANDPWEREREVRVG
jgi:hypothetical protein